MNMYKEDYQYMAQKRLFAVLIIFTIFFGWHCGYERIAPNELVGIWKTSAPKYVDRFFKIDQDIITIGTGGENVEIYTIKKIRTKKDPTERSLLYTIYYENEEGVECKFAFYYSSENGGVIRLKNQRNIVWTKHR